MGRLNSYPNVTYDKVSNGDEIIIDGVNGTRNMTLYQLNFALNNISQYWNHRFFFRGKELGTKVTDEKKAAISNGTFDDMFIGDFWNINDIIWRIVDIDYWYGKGDQECTKHHLVIMPDKSLYGYNMNDEATTDGGYALSKLRNTGLNKASDTINSIFGESNILKHRIYIVNGVEDGREESNIWVDSTVEIPTEFMMYGAYIRKSMNTGNPMAVDSSVDLSQFALMQLRPYTINMYRQNIWLRDVVSKTSFAAVGMYGHASRAEANNPFGVRPVFGLTGGDAA